MANYEPQRFYLITDDSTNYDSLITIIKRKHFLYSLVPHDKLFYEPDMLDELFIVVCPVEYVKEVYEFYVLPWFSMYAIVKQPDNFNRTYYSFDRKRLTYIELQESDNDSTVDIYGKTQNCLVIRFNYTKSNENKIYERIYKNFFELSHGISLVCDRPEWYTKLHIQKFINIATGPCQYIITWSLNDYCIKNKTIITSDDVKYIGAGSFNVVVHIKSLNEVLRINLDESCGWKKESYELLIETKDSGFAPINKVVVNKVHGYEIRYLQMSLLKPLPEIPDKNKMIKCIDRVINFVKNNPKYIFIDCQLLNFASSLDETEYYVSDVDLEVDIGGLPSDEDIKKFKESYAENLKRKRAEPIGGNMKLASAFCNKFKFEINNYSMTVVILKLFQISGFRLSLFYGEDEEKQLLKLVKPLIN